MTVTRDDGAVLGGPESSARRTAPLVVYDRVAECYKPGSRPAMARSAVRLLVVHHTSLSQGGADNPHPVPDEHIDGPALAARFVANAGLGTGQCVPYHGLTLWSGRNEQMLPLSVRGAHALGVNGVSWAWAIVGEERPASFEQLSALADVCAVLSVLGGGLELMGHADVPGGSRDAQKTCPRPTVDMDQLRALVRDRMPSGWRLWSTPQAEDYAVSAGLRL